MLERSCQQQRYFEKRKLQGGSQISKLGKLYFG
jgi:hypothetical protein